MKVLHLAAGNLFGGVETYLITLARLRHLCPEMEPHFGLCFPGRLRDELGKTGVQLHELGAVRVSRPWTIWQGRSRLTRILRDGDYSVVLTHGMWPHAIFGPAACRLRIKLATVIHDCLDTRHWLNRWARRTPPDVVVANSHFTASPAARVFPRTPVVAVYPVAPAGVDRTEARAAIRTALGTALETVVILQAARLEEWKGHLAHIEALGQLKDVAGWEAWFAGGPQKAGEAELLARMKQAAVRLGIADRVKFLGQRADVPWLMAAADVYCQPNTGPEPFGVSLVEALHAQLPVVASRSGGAVEIVNETCGILCPPGDVGAVADALRKLITKPERRRELGERGPARATELCDPARQIAALATAIKSA